MAISGFKGGIIITVTKNGSSTVSGIALKAGTEIEGIFTSITQTSAGSVIAYSV